KVVHRPYKELLGIPRRLTRSVNDRGSGEAANSSSTVTARTTAGTSFFSSTTTNSITTHRKSNKPGWTGLNSGNRGRVLSAQPEASHRAISPQTRRTGPELGQICCRDANSTLCLQMPQNKKYGD